MATENSSFGGAANAAPRKVARKPVADQVLRQIERFLYREAVLID